MPMIFRMRGDLLHRIHIDLQRPHRFASERVGFILCRAGHLTNKGIVIMASDYQPVDDEDYLNLSHVDGLEVGATMGPAALRKALQIAYNNGGCDMSMFHVHHHNHLGMPGFSQVDDRESRRFVPDFFNIAPRVPHGAIVLSDDMAYGKCWTSKPSAPVEIDRFAVLGAPFRFWRRQ
jgi:hypothetical protein